MRELLIENRRQPMVYQQVAVKFLLVTDQSGLGEPMICFDVGKRLYE